MCLAEAYHNTRRPENLVCRYVSNIGFRDSKIVLTDVLGREIEIDGKLDTVDLVNNIVMIRSTESAGEKTVARD